MNISRIGINPFIVNLLPPTPKSPTSLIDILPKPAANDPNYFLITQFKLLQSMNSLLAQLKGFLETSKLNYSEYLQIGNPVVRDLALDITQGLKTDDEKMYAIEQWVQQNIEYVSDIVNYGQLEYWAYPTETLNKMSGDCEDGAFLIHALGLAAGVDEDRLRMYGGMVANPRGGKPEGHGWVAYKRQLDNVWVILDWCYWPQDDHFDYRTPMSKDYKYMFDFFYVTASKTVETPFVNTVRTAYGATKGNFVNIKV